MSTTRIRFPLSPAFARTRAVPAVRTLLLGALLTSALALAGVPAKGASGKSSASADGRNIVAVFRLDGPLTEVPTGDDLAVFGPIGTSLKELVERMDKAADDPAVKAVVILPESTSPGPGQVEELREALARIRGRGKEVYVYADSLTMGQYILACGASRISMVPTGSLLVPGLVSSSLHVRGLLDKIGVKPDFLTEGAYKSAAELFMREQPSPQADEMMNWLMDSWYASFVDEIATGRKVAAAKVRGWLDKALFSANQAKADGLIDAVEQRQDFQSLLKDHYGSDVVFDKKYGRQSQPELDLSSPFSFLKIWGELLGKATKKAEERPAVGIVYVSGPIMIGRGTSNPFSGSVGAYSTKVRQALEAAAADSSIKAVVLRIDSPGGSATASEIILDATKRVKAKKPLVVSMGDVAGSGGYYVACGADTVFADATTLTGSIGVVGGKFATTAMWNKIGVTFKEYKRGENAGMFTSDEVFTESERARMKLFMDDVYAAFKKHVKDIRGNRLKKPIDDLAGGRVYTGKQALNLGLVDRLGSMSDAIAFAADQAGIKNYDVRVVPQPKGFLEQLMEQISGSEDDSNQVALSAGGDSLLKLAKPYLRNLDPRRTAAVASVLRRLEILQKEGVVLTMPEILPPQ